MGTRLGPKYMQYTCMDSLGSPVEEMRGRKGLRASLNWNPG